MVDDADDEFVTAVEVSWGFKHVEINRSTRDYNVQLSPYTTS